MTNYHKPSSIKHQNFFLLQFWRSDVQNQGVGRAKLPLQASKDPSVHLPVSGSSWNSLACGHLIPIPVSFSQGLLHLYVSLCVSLLSLVRTLVT